MSDLIENSVAFLRSCKETYWQPFRLKYAEQLVYLSGFGHVHIAIKLGDDLRVCWGGDWTKRARVEYGQKANFEPIAFRITSTGEGLRENMLSTEHHQFSLGVPPTIRVPLPAELKDIVKQPATTDNWVVMRKSDMQEKYVLTDDNLGRKARKNPDIIRKDSRKKWLVNLSHPDLNKIMRPKS